MLRLNGSEKISHVSAPADCKPARSSSVVTPGITAMGVNSASGISSVRTDSAAPSSASTPLPITLCPVQPMMCRACKPSCSRRLSGPWWPNSESAKTIARSTGPCPPSSSMIASAASSQVSPPRRAARARAAPAVTLAEAASGASSSIRSTGSPSGSVRGSGAASRVWAGSASGMALLLVVAGCSRRV